jgi:hypothetical protein
MPLSAGSNFKGTDKCRVNYIQNATQLNGEHKLKRRQARICFSSEMQMLPQSFVNVRKIYVHLAQCALNHNIDSASSLSFFMKRISSAHFRCKCNYVSPYCCLVVIHKLVTSGVQKDHTNCQGPIKIQMPRIEVYIIYDSTYITATSTGFSIVMLVCHVEDKQSGSN